MSNRLRFIKRDKDRHGKERLYFRAKGMPLVPLPSPENSPAFMKAYAECLVQKEQASAHSTPPTSRHHGRITVRELSDHYYCSVSFKKVKSSTKRTYRSSIEAFCCDHGHRFVDDISTPKLDIIINSLWRTPAAANKLIKRLRTLMKLAIRLGHLQHNPAIPLEFYPTGEIHTWTPEEIGLFLQQWPSGSKERLSLLLHLYTGQRRSDVVKMRWEDVAENHISVTQFKTGTKLKIPLHPKLASELELHRPTNAVGAILKTQYGKAFSRNGYGNWFSKTCDQAQLPKKCRSHGLRKAAAVLLAEAGCTTKEIMSITGHKSLSDVELYTREVDQPMMAQAAMDKLIQKGSDTQTREKVSHANDNTTNTKGYKENGGPGGTRTPNQAVMSRRL